MDYGEKKVRFSLSCRFKYIFDVWCDIVIDGGWLGCQFFFRISNIRQI